MKALKHAKRTSGIIILAALSLLAMVAVVPGAASAKETMLYHGNGFAIRPATVSNWEYHGYQSGMSGGQTVAGPRGTGNSHLLDGHVTWSRWSKRSAVGTGGLHTYCGTLPRSVCKSSPWFGTPRVKVRAYKLKSGHFSKMRITRLGKGAKQFMVLRFNGQPHRTPAWKVIRDVKGQWAASSIARFGRSSTNPATRQRKPPTLLYHGNGFAYRPSIVSGWTKDSGESDFQIFGGVNGRNQGNWGRIAWSKWNHVRAVGYGKMWSPDCEAGADCDEAYPWNGTPGRVVANRTKRGHFTKMKLTTRDGPGRPYELTVKYVGLRKSGVSWKVVREVGG